MFATRFLQKRPKYIDGNKSTQLLKYVKDITLIFNPYGDGVTGTKELGRYFSGKKAAYSNPKAVVNIDIVATDSPPCINVVFLNNSKWTLDTTGN